MLSKSRRGPFRQAWQPYTGDSLNKRQSSKRTPEWGSVRGRGKDRGRLIP